MSAEYYLLMNHIDTNLNHMIIYCPALYVNEVGASRTSGQLIHKILLFLCSLVKIFYKFHLNGE